MLFAAARLASESAIGSRPRAGARNLAHLAEREVERPARGEEAARRLPPLLGGFIVEHGRELREARQIGLGVGGILDRCAAN